MNARARALAKRCKVLVTGGVRTIGWYIDYIFVILNVTSASRIRISGYLRRDDVCGSDSPPSGVVSLCASPTRIKMPDKGIGGNGNGLAKRAAKSCKSCAAK